ncbi:hypothetical protein V3C99_018416, partial [Haemonchus contortus]
DHYP